MNILIKLIYKFYSFEKIMQLKKILKKIKKVNKKLRVIFHHSLHLRLLNISEFLLELFSGTFQKNT